MNQSLLLVLATLLGTALGVCRRAGGTDCATANQECIELFDKETGDAISELGWPPENHQECHRTCFEDNICKTHFRNQRSIEVTSHDPTLYTIRRISSPRFGNSTYRKSTNCRFNLQCSEGQFLTYSVIDSDLQDKIDCSSSDQPVCVDWLNHHIGAIVQNHKVCGTGETGEVESDGADNMMVEFVANRDSVVLDGFEYFITCTADAFDNHAVNMGLVQEATPEQRRQAEQCTTPPAVEKRQAAYYNPRPRSSPSYDIFLVLERSNYITLDYLTVNVHRGEHGTRSYRAVYYLIVTNRFSTRSYPLWHRNRRQINGYGYLWILGLTAYFYQTGANPVFVPSAEEKVVIHRLETALNRVLGDTGYYDVVDELDEEDPTPSPSPTPRPGYGVPGPPPVWRPYPTPGVPDPPTTTTLRPKGSSTPVTRPTGPPGVPTVRPTSPPLQGPPGPPGVPPGEYGRRAVVPSSRFTAQQGTLPPRRFQANTDAELALRYGNACNGVLRAIACAYQYKVLQRNCTNTEL